MDWSDKVLVTTACRLKLTRLEFHMALDFLLLSTGIGCEPRDGAPELVLSAISGTVLKMNVDQERAGEVWNLSSPSSPTRKRIARHYDKPARPWRREQKF